MNYQSRINLIRSRIQQIRESDLFSKTEKEKLIKVNKEELVGYQFLAAAQRIEAVKVNYNFKKFNQPKSATN